MQQGPTKLMLADPRSTGGQSRAISLLETEESHVWPPFSSFWQTYSFAVGDVIERMEPAHS